MQVKFNRVVLTSNDALVLEAMRVFTRRDQRGLALPTARLCRLTTARAPVTARRPESYPVLIGCRHGKDRTGLLAMLLLGGCGFGRAAITADYSISEDSAEMQLAVEERSWAEDGAKQVRRHHNPHRSLCEPHYIA